MKKVALLLVLCLAGWAMAADMKVVTRHTTDSPYDQPMTEIVYIQGQRHRREFHSGKFTGVTIYQCDLHRVNSLNENTKTYSITELDEHGLPKRRAGLDITPTSRLTRSDNQVTRIETVTDTGERKDFSGLTAKHLIKTTRMEPQRTSCSNYGEGQKVDGRYIELPAELSCEPQRSGVGVWVLAASSTHCFDNIQLKRSGPHITGIPVQQTTTELGEHAFTTRVEPVEVSQEKLDPKLFEIPPGYTEYSAFDATVHYYWERLKDAVARMF